MFIKQVPQQPRERFARIVRKRNENVAFEEAPFVDGKHHKFEISIDFDKQVEEIATA